jgi:hypothetical protein
MKSAQVAEAFVVQIAEDTRDQHAEYLPVTTRRTQQRSYRCLLLTMVGSPESSGRAHRSRSATVTANRWPERASVGHEEPL